MSQALGEFHNRLTLRLSECLSDERELLLLEVLPMSRSMANIQHDFVSHTESLHQCIYASLSQFALILRHTAPHVNGRQIQTSSITNFLKELVTLLKIPDITDEISVLEKSRYYRAKYVDHPCDASYWLTFMDGLPDEPKLYLLYSTHQFVPAEIYGDGLIEGSVKNGFKVPYHIDVILAYRNLVIKTLKAVISSV